MFLVGHDGRSVRPTREAEGKIGPDKTLDAGSVRKRRCHLVAMHAKIEGERKAGLDVVEAGDEPAGDLALEEASAIPGARGAFASLAQQRAVENQQGIRRRHARM